MLGMILITGPESTGARLFTNILSRHPLILGTQDAQDHHDLLDEMWGNLQIGDIVGALACLPDMGQAKYLLTRRAVPHGRPGINRSTEVPEIGNLYEMCRQARMDLVVLITTRSTAANLSSWALNRISAGGSLKSAIVLYENAYRHIFDFLLHEQEIPFFFLSLEALLLDGQRYIWSVFQLLGLPPCKIDIDLDLEVNAKRYDWYNENGRSIKAMKAEQLLHLGTACMGDFDLLKKCLDATRARKVVMIGSGLGVLSAAVMEYSEALLLSIDIDPDVKEKENLESVGLFDQSRIAFVWGDSVGYGKELIFFGRDEDKPEGALDRERNMTLFDIITVDGDHDYEQVKADIEAWVPHLRPGGIMFFHDYDAKDAPMQHPGVKQAVDESEVAGWPVFGRAGWSIAFQKPEST